MGEIIVDMPGFAADCRHLLDEVAEHGTRVVITRDGRPVAELHSLSSPPSAETKPLFGFAKGTFVILGDIVAPLDEEWDCEHETSHRDNDR